MSTLIHITPQLPPAIDGVGDYCWNLWQHWPEQERDWEFLVAHGARETMTAHSELNVREFALNGSSLAAALEQSSCGTAVLHYVGYAYQPKGMPVWLPGALASWRERSPRRQLVVMFHEMYARSSPLRSPFWVAPFARRIIRELVELSSGWMTSCERYFNQLVHEFHAVPERGRIIPIASNIPALHPLRPHAKVNGPRRVVVFGLSKTRLWALERHWKLLRKLAGEGLIEYVTLLGKSPTAADEAAAQVIARRIGGDVVWRERFDLSPPQISEELAQHDIGLLANEPDILTKSGAFAALATHGVMPVISVRGDAALPPSLRGTSLINDDRSTVSRVVQLLRDSDQYIARREKLLGFVERELGWSGITSAWKEVLQRAAGGAIAATPAPASVLPLPRALKLEVPA